jgi:DNA-directed RNA polymerase subunit RPC12/RpoP
MSPAPVLKGYLCRVCGQERIQTPWNASDGYVCGNCGANNQTPLLEDHYDLVNFTPLLPGEPLP